jgi:hypothetical protein
MNDPVSDPDELASTLPHFCIGEQTDDAVEGRGVIAKVAGSGFLMKRPGRIPPTVNQSAARLADALRGALCKQGALTHIEELVLDRGASGVENQNPHDLLVVDWA